MIPLPSQVKSFASLKNSGSIKNDSLSPMSKISVSNPHNLVKATVSALTEMRDAYTVAGLRGIPMSKVFKG